jgi:hypothetical protein
MTSYGERAMLSLNFRVEHEPLALTSFGIAQGSTTARHGRPAVLT